MAEIDKDLEANYRALKEERGLTWEQLAEQIDAVGDKSTAAWLRSQAEPDKPKRTRAAKSEA